MLVRSLHADLTQIKTDVVIVNLFEGVTVPGGATGAVDRATGGMIRRLISLESFEGKLGEHLSFYTEKLGPQGASQITKVVVMGLGPKDEFDIDGVRRVAAASIKAARSTGAKRIATIVHGGGIGGLDPSQAAEALVEGALLGAYRFSRYKSESPQADDPEELILVENESSKLPALDAGIARGQIFAESTNWARDLVNTPPNDLSPAQLAEAARALGEEVGLSCTVLDAEEMRRLGMGGLLAIAQGSVNAPRLILLEYTPKQVDPSSKECLALVGKGVTFDSGGLSIKSADGMTAMKNDMAGAAAVLGAMRAIARIGAEVRVIGVIPAVENMPSGASYRPGDVLRTMSGKTIEVLNTDAEGRIILADAVSYALSQGATAVVDIATLTGACEIALGNVFTGLISNNDSFYQRFMEAAEQTGERFWRFPTHPEYKEQYKSDVADIKNVGGRSGGAITGGLIIGEFAGATPWIHLDIAATATRGKSHHYDPKGATGVGVRTLTQLATTLKSGSIEAFTAQP